MASFSADAELMTNYVSARAVPGGSRFKAILDENANPMVVALSDDRVPQLQMIRQDVNGVQHLFDLGQCCRLPADSIIQAFDIVQGQDSNLYMAIAFTTDGKTSRVICYWPFLPSSAQPGVHLGVTEGSQSIGMVQGIFLSSMAMISLADTPDAYPLVLLTHRNLDQSVAWGDDLTQLVVSADRITWTASSKYSPPVNVAGIVDICPARTVHGHGIFVLYKIGDGSKRLYGQFSKPDPLSSKGAILNWPVTLQCPADATCIETTQEDRGFSGLIIGAASGLHYLDATRSTNKSARPAQITSAKTVQGCKSLTVVQDSDNISVWFTSSANALGYVRCNISALKSNSIPAPNLLLKGTSSSSFSAVITASKLTDVGRTWQTVISNDMNGNLTLLTQASDTSLWRNIPFFANDSMKNYEVKSYSITIKAFDEKGQTLPKAGIRVKSSTAFATIMNGANMTLSGAADWLTADSQGTLNFIVPTDTLGAQVLTLDGLRTEDGNSIAVETKIIDPAGKAMAILAAQMSKIDTVDKLKMAKTQSGTPLFDPHNMPSDADLKTSLDTLQSLQKAYASMPQDGSVVPSASAQLVSQDTRALSMNSAEGAFEINDDWFWDSWNWVRENVEDATDWVVEKAGEVWTFTCKLAGDAKDFVLDCLEKVGEAISWVWDKIKVVFWKVIDFVGWIFDWDDMKNTAETFATLLSAGCDLATNKLGTAIAASNTFFDNVSAMVDGITVQQDVVASAESANSEAKGSPTTVQNCLDSTSFNWVAERMKYGGMSTSPAATDQKPVNNFAQQSWETSIGPALAEIRDAVSKVGDDIKDLWNKSDSITGSDLLRLGKDTLKAIITAVKSFCAVLLAALQNLMQVIKLTGESEVQLPIFSPIFNDIKGHYPSWFEAIGFLIAVPTTIFTKLITQHAPPVIDGLDATLLGGLICHDPVEVTDEQRKNFNTLTTGVTISITMLKNIYTTIKFGRALENEQESENSLGAFMKFYGAASSMVTAMNVIPKDKSRPGFTFHEWIMYFALTRGGCQTLAVFVKVPDKEKLLSILDLSVGLVNFGLYQATMNAEIEARDSWKDYNADSVATGVTCACLELMALVGESTAFLTKEDLLISVPALVIGDVCKVALAAEEGVKWNIEYNEEEETLLVASN